MNDKSSTTFPPNQAIQAFVSFLGEWSTVGTHGMIPNSTLHGHTSFARHKSGAFLEIRSTILEDISIPQGLARIGRDDSHALVPTSS